MAVTPDHLLALAYLQEELYTRALDVPDLLAEESAERGAVTAMRDQETARIARLRALGGTRARPDAFDFSGGGSAAPGSGPFEFSLDDPWLLLQVAMLLEDVGVRAHLAVLRDAIDPASVAMLAGLLGSEARHAAMVRRFRNGGASFIDIGPWVTETSPGFDFLEDEAPSGESQVDLATLAYGVLATRRGATGGEDNLQQGAVRHPVDFSYDDFSATEAFDEPIAEEALATFLSRFLLA